MVKIRLTRTGKKHAPHYRIIAIQARTKRDGEALEYLGYYNPRTNPSTVELKKDRIEYWISNGAQPTDTVKRLLVNADILKKDKSTRKFNTKPGEQNLERKKQKEEKKESAKAKKEEKTKSSDDTKDEEKKSDDTKKDTSTTEETKIADTNETK